MAIDKAKLVSLDLKGYELKIEEPEKDDKKTDGNVSIQSPFDINIGDKLVNFEGHVFEAINDGDMITYPDVKINNTDTDEYEYLDKIFLANPEIEHAVAVDANTAKANEPIEIAHNKTNADTPVALAPDGTLAPSEESAPAEVSQKDLKDIPLPSEKEDKESTTTKLHPDFPANNVVIDNRSQLQQSVDNVTEPVKEQAQKINAFLKKMDKGMKYSGAGIFAGFGLGAISKIVSHFVKNKTTAKVLSKTGLAGAVVGAISLAAYAIFATKRNKKLNQTLKDNGIDFEKVLEKEAAEAKKQKEAEKAEAEQKKAAEAEKVKQEAAKTAEEKTKEAQAKAAEEFKDTASKLAAANNKVAELNQKIKELEDVRSKDAEKLKKQAEKTTKELNEKTKELAERNEEISNLQQELKASKKEAQKAAQELEKKTKALQEVNASKEEEQKPAEQAPAASKTEQPEVAPKTEEPVEAQKEEEQKPAEPTPVAPKVEQPEVAQKTEEPVEAQKAEEQKPAEENK